MSGRQATVSVVIPTFNRGRVLAATVRSAAAQTTPPHEIIVVDDGSTDDTPAVCASLPAPVRTIRTPNGGVSAARNVGIAAARGDFIALLDADDIWPPEKLAVQLAVHAALPDVGWSCTDHRITDADGRPLPGRQGFARDFPCFDETGLAPDAFFARTMRRVEVEAAGSAHTVWTGDAYRLLFDGNFVFPSGALVRKDVAHRAGRWDEAFRVANDTEWFHRVAAVAPAAVIMTPLLAWRRGQSNTLMQGANVVKLVENAMSSLDRALGLRGEPDAALRATWAASRGRLALRLAYARLSVLDGAGTRAALRDAFSAGAPRAPRAAALWAASLLPPTALRGLHALKRLARRAGAAP